MTAAISEYPFLAVLIPALSSIFGAIFGVIVTHRFASRRDRDQKRREFALKYLIEAWQNIEEGSREDVDIRRKSQLLEKAIVDIQLFGSPNQIQMAKRWTDEMVSKSTSPTTPLLQDFQHEIRRELGLKRSPVSLFFFRLTPLAQTPTQPPTSRAGI
jgi:hypothetical protein